MKKRFDDYELLTSAEAAEVLKIGRQTLYELNRRYGLASAKLGRSYRFRLCDIMAKINVGDGHHG